MEKATYGAALPGNESSIPMIQITFPPLSAKSALAHFRWIHYRRGMTAQQEITPGATKAFHSCLLMSLNTESEQDPPNLLTFQVIYQTRVTCIYVETVTLPLRASGEGVSTLAKQARTNISCLLQEAGPGYMEKCIPMSDFSTYPGSASMKDS